MRLSTPFVWAVFFGAAIACTVGTSASASSIPTIDGTYAAVTPKSVELLHLHLVKREIRGTYRILRLDSAQTEGIDDRTVALTSIGGLTRDRSLNLDHDRTMLLRFDAIFQNAEAVTAVPHSRTQAFSRVTPEQIQLLQEMAHYGGLSILCQAHRGPSASAASRAFCAGMSDRLATIVPFRPFPRPTANRPVLYYALAARLDRNLASNR